MSSALQPLPATYAPDPNAPDFRPLESLPGYQAPVQGWRDRLALALQGAIPAVPTTRQPGESPTAGFLTGLLAGGARGFANVGTERINARQKLDQALGQTQHEKNALAIEASKEGRKLRTVTPEMAQQRGWPAEYVGQQIGDLPKEATSAAPKPKEKVSSDVTMNDVLSSNNVLNMGDIGTSWDDPGIKAKVNGKQPEKPLPASMAVLKSGDKNDIAAAFRRGEIDPGMLNLSGRGVAAPILAILEKPGPNGEPPWNQAKAKLQWNAMQALTRNANGPQILNLQRAAQSVNSATALMEDLNRQLTEAVRHAPIPRSEIPESNKIVLAAALRGAYGPRALDIARRFDTQARVVRTEYPTVLSGGYAPQQAQIDDAQHMIDPLYGEGGTASALATLRQDAIYKVAAVNGIGANTPGVYGQNPYGAAPQYAPGPLFPMAAPGGAPPSAPAMPAAPAAPPQPKVRVRSPGGVVGDVTQGWLDAHPAYTRVVPVKEHTRAVSSGR